MAGSIVPIMQGAAKRVATAERSQLVGIHEHIRALSDDYIRRLVIDHNRIDILATEVLGYQIQPFHLRMMQWQFRHPVSLQLVFRGAGKTTTCTITKIIHYILLDRNIRILIASKTKTNSEGFLKEIKGHLETNDKLIRIFGEFYDPAKVGKWDNSEIEVVGRTRVAKEATVTCVGVESAVVSKHYDVIMSDDLVDEDNTRTKHMRDRTKTWYYQTLDPTLMPNDPEKPWVGNHHHLGTHYHFDDLWNHLKSNELKDATQVIPALSERGQSPWPEKYPPKWFEEKRQKAGSIIFRAQYQCDTEAMKGEIFAYDDCQILNSSEWPDEEDLTVTFGIDLAISGKEENDQFAMVKIGCRGKPFRGKMPEEVYVMDFYAKHLRFPKQKPKVLEWIDRDAPLAVAIETNQYQDALAQSIEKDRPGTKLVKIHTHKDKITRAWRLSPLFEAKKVFFRKGSSGVMIDQLVLFPHYKLKDLFDAFDHAIAAFMKRRRRANPRPEPKVM